MIGGVLLVDGLKHDLISINQLCDKDNFVTFSSSECRIFITKFDQTIFTSSRNRNTYIVNLNKIPSNDVCLLSMDYESWLWNKIIAHIHMEHLNKLVHKD